MPRGLIENMEQTEKSDKSIGECECRKAPKRGRSGLVPRNGVASQRILANETDQGRNGESSSSSRPKRLIKRPKRFEHDNIAQDNNNAQVCKEVKVSKADNKNKVCKKTQNVKRQAAEKSKLISKESNLPALNDGILLSVDQDEDELLDYIDDVDLDEENGMVDRNCDSEVSSCFKETSDKESEMHLGATGASMSDEEKLLKNPSLRKLFNQLLDEKIQQATKKG